MGKSKSIIYLKYFWGLLLITIVLLALGQKTCANEHINRAIPYTQVNWPCVTANEDQEFDFRTGVTYPGEAYWFGGNDDITTFRSYISSGRIPGGYNENATDRTGIDCSSFVSRAWGIGWHSTRSLPDVSRKIKKEHLQTGDILNNPAPVTGYGYGHVYLFHSFSSDGSINVYHAKGEQGSNPNRPEGHPLRGKMVIYEMIPYPNSSFVPRRRGLAAPTGSSIPNEAIGISTNPTLTVYFKGPLRPESINSSSIILRENYLGAPSLPGEITYDVDDPENCSITFTPSIYLNEDTEYQFIVTDKVKDLESRGIDGDNDENVNGDFTVIFTTRPSLLSGFIRLDNWSFNQVSESSGMSASEVIASGTGDNIIDPGETFEISLTLSNVGTQAAESVSGTLFTSSAVNITEDTKSFGNLAAGGSASNVDKFVFSVPSGYIEDEIPFKLIINGWIDGKFSSEEFNFILPVGTTMVAPPGSDISEITDWGLFGVYSIDDDEVNGNAGNGNGKLDMGDHEVTIIFYAGNSSNVPINAMFELGIDTNKVQLEESAIKEFSIPKYSYIEVPYKIFLYNLNGNSIATVIRMSIGGSSKYLDFYLPIEDGVVPDPNSGTFWLSSVSPPDVFSPNGDKTRDELEVKFKLWATIPVNSVSLLVREKYGEESFGEWRAVSANHNIGNKIKKDEEYWFKWKGIDEESGCYQVRVKLKYADYYNRNILYSRAHDIYLHKISPQAESLSTAPSAVGWNANLKGSTNLSFNLTLSADLDIILKNEAEELIKEVTSEALSFKGPKSYDWDCYDASDSLMPDGKYTFHVDLDDRANTPVSYVKKIAIDHAPQDFYIVTSTSETITPTKEFSLSWTSASPYGPEWNHLKEYQILGRKVDEDWEDFGVLKNHVSPETTATIVDLLTEGIWEIKVRAIDEEGNWCDSDGTNSAGYAGDPQRNLIVRVDTVPPAAFSIYKPYDGEYFDGRGVQIEWNSSSDPNFDYYEFCIGTDPEDIHGTSIYTERFGSNVTSCEVNLPGGIYYIYVAAYDKAGNYRAITEEDGHWPSFEIDSLPPTIAFNWIAYPPLTNPHFSPDGDGIKDSTEIRFNIVDDSYYYNFPGTMEVKVEILDGDDKVVKSWEIPEFVPGWGELAWDGVGDNGLGVMDGIYNIRISATDKALNTATSESLTVVVDTASPNIKNIANSGIFSPNGDGQFDADTLSFELSDNLSESLAASVEVLDQSSETIASILNSPAVSCSSEPLSLDWDGTRDTGLLTRDGDYRYRIVAVDQAGNASMGTALVTIDTIPPAFTGVSTSPRGEVSFTDTSGALDISFTVSELANVRLVILDSNYSIIRDYVIPADAGIGNTISWDGKDSFGSLVPDNTYITYAFSATDQVANSSSYGSTDIVKVNTPITGLAGTILYSPDGVVKIIVPAGAVEEGTELYIDMFDTPPKSYQVSQKDNITLTYKFGPEDVTLDKQATMTIHYDESLLNFEDQSVELWRYGSEWTKLYGNTHSDIFTAYIEKTGEFALFADLTPPAPPVISQPESPTRDKEITIFGIAEPYSKVDLWINGLKRSPPINAGSDGNFFADLVLSEGVNTLCARATDQTGNAGATSEVILVELDTTPPKITLYSPQDIYISPNGDGVQEEATILADTDGVSIVITVQDQSGNVLASSDTGSLTVGGGLLTADGTYIYTVKAYDALGNEAKKQGLIIVDSTPPEAYLETNPINYVISGILGFSGIAEDSNFDRYILEYGAGENPPGWTMITESFVSVDYEKIYDFDTVFLDNGVYTFRLRVYDKAGNLNTSSLSRNIINGELYGTISSPVINQVVSGTIEVHGNIEGVFFAEYKLEYGAGTSPAAWTIIQQSTTLPAGSLLGSWDTTQVSDGIYTLKLNVINAGGESSIHSIPIKVDNSAPLISITFPIPDAVLAGSIDILGQINDANFSFYTIEYAKTASPSDWNTIQDPTYIISSPLATWDTTLVSDGTYLLKLTVTDRVGHSSSTQIQVIVDNTFPIVTISSPSSGDILGGTISIIGTVSDDNLDSILLEYRETSTPEVWHAIAAIDLLSIINGTIYDWDSGSLNGDYTIRVTANDKTGKTTSDEVSIRLDNIAPLIDITSPTEESINTGMVEIVGEISDLNLDNYTIKYGYGIEPTRWWDLTSGNTSVTGTLYSWDTPNVKDGYYTIAFDAVDKAENSSHHEFVITIDNAPAVAEIHEPTSDQVARGDVAVSGIACDADFTTYNFERFEVLYGEGANPTSWITIESLVIPKINEILTNWNTAVLSDGIYTLKLRSQDISGITEDTRTVVVDNTNPIVSISSPSAGQTVSGNIQITGTASDTNFSEYKVYYKDSGSSTWTEIGGGTSSINNSTLASWNTIAVGDGSYSIKLWVKDQAGNESEVARDVTVNNVLAIVNDSASPTTISPNGDGIDDVASINYTLSENSPITIKIYKKPEYDKFKWEAKGYGTRYLNQPFSYTLSASGTNYPAQAFSWQVDASGMEEPVVTSRSGSVPGSNYGLKETGSWTFPVTSNISGYYPVGGGVIADQPNGYFVGKKTNVGLGIHYALQRRWVGAHINYGTAIDPVPTPSVDVRYQVINGDGQTSYVGVWPLSEITMWNLTQTGCDVKLWMYYDIHASNNDFIDYWVVFPDEAKFEWVVSGSTPRHNVSASDFGSATIRRDNTAAPGSDLSYSVTLSGDYGGAITEHSISYVQTSNVGGVSSSRDSSGWNGNTCSGSINASYIYPGDGWSSSSNGSDSCNALDGTINVSNSMSNIFGPPNTYPDYREYSSFTVSDNNPNVSVRFKKSNGSSSSDPSDYLIASTSYSESWDTSNDPAVGNNGWIQSGEISPPFNYDESSQSISIGYNPPSNVVLSSWTVNLLNPSGGSSSDVELDGAPTPDGNFEVKIADSMLVKTLQYNASTAPGSQSIEWDGTDSGGSYVADGDYIYYIYAGPNIVKKSGLIKVQKSSEITSASLSEEYISPNADGIRENTTINYTLSETASVNIEVSDKDGTVVKSFAASGNQGANSTSWDGRNNSGAVVEDGEYTINIKATHANGSLRTEELRVVVDNNSPTAGDVPAQEINPSGYDPVYSPDKSRIAYVKELSGKKQVFSMDLSNSLSTQLTGVGNNFQPAWSPDGNKLSFTSDRSGNNDVWIMDAGGDNLKQITSDNASETSPAFSPDGQKIAYASNRTGRLGINKWNIWVVDLDGTNPTQITAHENNSKDDYPTWSPDGHKLGFASDQGGNFDIWRINLDGSVKTQVSSSPETETTPSWSPDGFKMIYTRGNDIYLKKLSTGEEMKIAGGANPAWSRDGTEVIYNTTNSEIYSKNIYAGALTGLITQPILNQTLTGLVEVRGTALDTNLESYKLEFSRNVMPYSWLEIANSSTPIHNGILGVWNTADVLDGEYILRLTVNDKAGNSLQNTVVVNADNDNWKLTVASLTQLTSSDAWDVEPAWSPDASKIAFSSSRSGNYDIWVMNADGTGLQNISNHSAYDDKPVWSPDGTKITFVSDRSGNKDIWVANADSSGTPLQLTTLTIVDTDPTWSPDGTKIAFASDRSDNFDIWIINSDGTGAPTKLTSSEACDKEPSWSQFGVAFTSDRSGDKEIWMIEDVNNPNLFRLTYDSAEDKEPSWSPIAIPLSDGSLRPLIAFTSTRNDNQDIFIMDTDGIDQSKSLTDYANVDCAPAWSPDGTKVAFASFKDGNYDIWLMKFDINTTILSVRPGQVSLKPVLRKPADDSTVYTLRPAFEWIGVQGITDYRVELAKIPSWTSPDRRIAKIITQTEAATPEPYIVARIDEFDEGLDRDDWYWKIFAISGTQEISSGDPWKFTVAPELTLTGVTNYPNPFNPNREETKIRYRLGATAGEVKIRIYDVVGSLVREIDNCPTEGELSSIWDKYHDVDWDGRNGRGDMVVNGIYPFEVIARLGDKTVSGRGKVAVLK